MNVIITRFEFSETQTLGELVVYDDNQPIFKCKTIELEVDKNAKRDDAIPYGAYEVVKRVSSKYGNHFHVLNVPNRDYILIHNANYSRQLLGCIAVGQKHLDIDNDGLKDVTSSKLTLKRLNEVLPDSFSLEIKKAD